MQTSAVKQFPDGIELNGWRLTSRKAPISNSSARDEVEERLGIPLPCMYFGQNSLTVTHMASGFSFDFNAFDALDLVDKTTPSVQVGWAEEWNKQREHAHLIKKVVKPFDWTYTTDYKGTLRHEEAVQVQATEEELDIASLRVQEPILFYDEVILYEDELDDNGSCVCNVRIRCMPSGYFILLRNFVRVDGVVVRINDTRIHHKFATDYILREHTDSEKGFSDLLKEVKNPSVLRQPDQVIPHLSLLRRTMDKISLR